MRTVEIAMTAVIRPEVLKVTLDTFKKFMFKDYPVQVVLNVDPVGDQNYRGIDIARMVNEVFHVKKYREPAEPSFPTAWKWCWQNTEADYVFHLEDDWELLRDVNMDDILNTMDANMDMAGMRLSNKTAGETEQKAWNKYCPYNGAFFEVPENLRGLIGTSGNPMMYRGTWCRMIAGIMTTDFNPEKQLRYNPEIEPLVLEQRWGVWNQPLGDKYVKDIGIGTRDTLGWKKDGGYNRAFFTHYSRK